MKLVWRISPKLKEQICHFPPDLKCRVWEAIEIVAKNPQAGKLLEEDLAGYRSYRIGRYRLIYRIKDDRLALEAVGPREHIYERIVLEIGRQKIRERAAKYRARKRTKTSVAA